MWPIDSGSTSNKGSSKAKASAGRPVRPSTTARFARAGLNPGAISSARLKCGAQFRRIRPHFRRIEAAVAAGDSATVESEHKELISRIDKAVQKGALHPNSGARKKSRAARLRAGSAA